MAYGQNLCISIFDFVEFQPLNIVPGLESSLGYLKCALILIQYVDTVNVKWGKLKW